MTDKLVRYQMRREAIREFVDELLGDIADTLEDEPLDIKKIEVLTAQLTHKAESLVKLNDKILENTALENVKEEVKVAERYESKITKAMTEASHLVRNQITEAGPHHSTDSQLESGQVHSLSAAVKLPRLEIPKYYGDISLWTSFWSQFEVAIDNNGKLASVDKFNYLKCYLAGSALSAISGLALDDKNYSVAVDILKTRFGRTDVVINAHTNKILSLQPVKRSTDTSGLRKLYDSCETEIRGLDALGVRQKSYGTFLFPIILNLLPVDITLEFSRRNESKESMGVEDLLTFLRKEVECRERAQSFTRFNNPEENVNRDSTSRSWRAQQYQGLGNPKPKVTSSAAALSIGTENICLFCKRTNHLSENCKAHNVESRKKILKKKGLCFICVTGRHLARQCKVSITCDRCQRRHHIAVCEDVLRRKEDLAGKREVDDSQQVQENETQTSKAKSETSVTNMIVPKNIKKTVLLKTARTLAKGEKRERSVRIMLDDGSQRSFVTEELSKSLGLPIIGEEVMDLYVFSKKDPVRRTCRRVTLTLKKRPEGYISIEALEVPDINYSLISVPGEAIQGTMRAKGLDLSDDSSAANPTELTVDVLVGSDCYWRLVTGETFRINESLVAVKNVFGWAIQGPDEPPILTTGINIGSVTVNKVILANLEVTTNEETRVSTELRKFWELESIGILDVTNEKSSDVEATKHFNETVRWKNGRYQVRLPWKDNLTEELADNYNSAYRRLKSMEKRFKQDKSLFNAYHETFRSYYDNGIIEDVVTEETVSSTPIYYLPHQPVIKEERSTTKLRIVFDGSAHEKGKSSLNDCLLSGANLNPDLFDLLIRFRRKKIAIVSDVKQAFLQIELAEEDRDSVRFLWFEEGQLENQSWKVKRMRFTRVLFGLTSSPFHLAATIRHHAQKYRTEFPETVDILDRDLYVDDLITGADDEELALTRSLEAKKILLSAGMELRKWQSNSKNLKRLWQKEGLLEKGEDNKTVFQSQSHLKVLGLTWDSNADIFTFQVEGLLRFLLNSPNTKRGVLQASARVFDPLGFLTPFTIRVKVLFQMLWEKGLQWDEDLPSELEKIWQSWNSELRLINTISVPRYYFATEGKEEIKESQVHCFSDSSETAYGAVVYVRYLTSNGNIGTNFISSKARVTPIKKVTLPRLELIGALLGARLMSRLLPFFQVTKENIFYWSDSMITLHWIKGSAKKYKQFVANRVMEIQAISDPTNWRFCKGSENPADILTRGLSVEELAQSRTWWHGPKWLSCPMATWPCMKKDELTVDECQKELRHRPADVSMNAIIMQGRKPLLKLEEKSTLNRVLRVTAWVMRYLSNLKGKNERVTGQLTTEEIERAKLYWIQVTQLEAFSDEIDSIRSKKEFPRNSKISSFKPFVDENEILRVSGRLQKSEFSYANRHPILLPQNQRFTQLLVKNEHCRSLHSGLGITLTKLREKYWIIKGRSLVKTVIQHCVVCRRWRAQPSIEETAPLPKDRVTTTPPFQTTGIDFAGPVYIREEKSKNTRKSYIALFTCAVTRAIHLELVSDLTASSFLLSLRRFISRRGLCKVIYSDNARTFKKAEKELAKLWEVLVDHRVQAYCTKEEISWKYIAEKAPWWGGIWERLVASTKSVLKKNLGKALLTYEEMSTVLAEVENILNSRPLTYINDDQNDPAPLTPSHFLILNGDSSLPTSRLLPVTASCEQLRKRWRYQQLLTNRLWQRWRKEYILQLKSAFQIKKANKISTPKKGDIVLVVEDNLPRQVWKLGRIEEVFIGRDGLVRSCRVKLPKGIIIRRPINLLCPLEIEDNADITD